MYTCDWINSFEQPHFYYSVTMNSWKFSFRDSKKSHNVMFISNPSADNTVSVCLFINGKDSLKYKVFFDPGLFLYGIFHPTFFYPFGKSVFLIQFFFSNYWHDVCSLWFALLWLNMYCLYHSVWLQQGIEMKTNKGGKKVLVKDLKLDYQTATFLSSNVYRRIYLSCLFKLISFM